MRYGAPLLRQESSRHGDAAGSREDIMGATLANFIVPIAIGAVAIVLVLGLVNMMRGGSPNRSQQLMRLRVLLQFVAIVIVMVTIWALGR
jgi:hypoxia induced protein